MKRLLAITTILIFTSATLFAGVADYKYYSHQANNPSLYTMNIDGLSISA